MGEITGHVTEERIIESIWDGVALSTTERGHVSLCPQCRQQVEFYVRLHEEFAVARLSQLTPEVESKLMAVLDQSKQVDQNGQESPLHRLAGAMLEWVEALPLWDSRQQASAVAVRNSNQQSYRLLFGADSTEVELMVEPQGGLLRIVGEVMMPEAQEVNGLALIELMAPSDTKRAIETESDAHGRFALEHVPPGRYVMTITPRYSPVVVIEPLELT